MTYIIGIGGVSRSGKSMLATKLKQLLSAKRVLHIDMDEYVLPEDELPKIKGHFNYEVPESIDYNRIIAWIKLNESNYDAIIIEGILAFANESLNQLYDMTMCMRISKSTYLNRRKVETRWGKEPDWYIEYVWDAHQKYGLNHKSHYILSGEKEVSEKDLIDILVEVGLK